MCRAAASPQGSEYLGCQNQDPVVRADEVDLRERGPDLSAGGFTDLFKDARSSGYFRRLGS